MSLEDEDGPSGGQLEAADGLVHGAGEERAAGVVGRHRVDGAQVPGEGAHTPGRVQRPRPRRAVARTRHDHVSSHVHILTAECDITVS